MAFWGLEVDCQAEAVCVCVFDCDWCCFCRDQFVWLIVSALQYSACELLKFSCGPVSAANTVHLSCRHTPPEALMLYPLRLWTHLCYGWATYPTLRYNDPRSLLWTMAAHDRCCGHHSAFLDWLLLVPHRNHPAVKELITALRYPPTNCTDGWIFSLQSFMWCRLALLMWDLSLIRD